MKFRQEQLPSLPPNSSPYHYYLHDMGMTIAKDMEIMFPMHPSEDFKYIVIINKKTGERVRLTLQED